MGYNHIYKIIKKKNATSILINNEFNKIIAGLTYLKENKHIRIEMIAA